MNIIHNQKLKKRLLLLNTTKFELLSNLKTNNQSKTKNKPLKSSLSPRKRYSPKISPLKNH